MECHPYWQQTELKKRIAPYGTVVKSWYPLGHGANDLINEPIFIKLDQKYGKSNVQIILRWHIQEGNIVFPKTTNPQAGRYQAVLQCISGGSDQNAGRMGTGRLK